MAAILDLIPKINSVTLPEGLPFSQISAWEKKFLYLLGRDQLDGTSGELVELGSGGGGSTAALCAGLAQNKRFDRSHTKLHAYDFFHTGKGTFASPKFFSQPPTDGSASYLEDFRERLAAYEDFVRVHAGDIWQTSDPDATAPIEFLHVDIAKTARVFRCVAERFLPRLTQDAILLHQDFAGPRLPWLHYSTGALLPYLEIVTPPIRSTLVVQVRSQPPRELLQRIAEDDFTVDERLELITAVQERLDRDVSGGIPFRPVLQLAKAFVCHYAEQPDRAWQLAEPLRTDPYLATYRADHFAQLAAARAAVPV